MGQYASYQNNTAADTGPYPSAGLWKKLDALSERKGRTYGLWDDFVTKPFTDATTEANWNPYKMFGSSSAAITAADVIGGVLVFTEATDNESVAIATDVEPFQIISTGGMCSFEARIAVSTIANTDSSNIIGLASNRTLIVGDPLTTSGALISTIDFIGWQRLEGDADQWEPVYQAGGSATTVVVADALTIVEDTYYKLGFGIDPDNDDQLRWTVDGQTQSDAVTVGTAAPFDVRMGMIYAQMAGAGTPGATSLDWWKCFQARVT